MFLDRLLAVYVKLIAKAPLTLAKDQSVIPNNR